jgi:hypothetical protein
MDDADHFIQDYCLILSLFQMDDADNFRVLPDFVHVITHQLVLFASDVHLSSLIS